MAPTVLAEKDFSSTLAMFMDMTIYFWIGLENEIGIPVYDNSEYEAYYCPKLVKLFYANLDKATIDLDTYQFTVHLATVDMLEDYTQVPNNPHHSYPRPLIEYMTMMGACCTEQDRGLKTSTTFHNIHCVGRWIQCNILGLDHITFLIGRCCKLSTIL